MADDARMLDVTFTDKAWEQGAKEINDLHLGIALQNLSDAALWQLDEKVAMILLARGYDLDYPPTNAYQPASLRESPDADDNVVEVTRRDYADAPKPGDTIGYVVAAENGKHMTHPYRNRSTADAMLKNYSPRPGDHVVKVDLDWGNDD